MIKGNLFLIFLGISVSTFAQVGINTATPTEKMDVNGTMRVRELPKNGEGIYTTGPNSTTTTKTGVFAAGRPLVSDTNGVVGQTTTSDLVPNSNVFGGATPDTSNTSAAMFMVKRFTVTDDVGGLNGKYSVNGFDTGIPVNQWQAIMSNVSWKFLTDPPTSNSRDQFAVDKLFNYRLQGAAGGNWKIVGDILNMQEQGYVDVMFIKAAYVAAEDRSN